MKRQDELIAFVRRYFDGESEAWLSMHLTSVDKDHAGWDELPKNQKPRVVYLDTSALPRTGGEEQTKYLIRLLKSWRSQSNLNLHRDVRAGNLLRPKSVDRPPRAAEFALLLIPKRNREHLVGDLEEEYRDRVLPEWGRFRAQFFYWEQTAIAVICYLWPVLKRILGLAAVWKMIGR